MQPSETVYDKLGQRWMLRTYRTEGYAWSGSTWPNPAEQDRDETVWTYQASTGLLTTKSYADGTSVGYTYTAEGRLATRTWARLVSGQPLVTMYGYDGSTGELSGISYSDGTLGVSYTHDRLGRLSNVKDAVDEQTGRTFGYNDDLQMVSETIRGLAPRTITRSYSTSGPLLGRPTGLNIGTEYATAWYYDDDPGLGTGRLNRVTGPGLPGNPTEGGAVYAYLDDSNQVTGTGYYDVNGNLLGSSWRTLAANRDVVEEVENKWGAVSPPVSKYHYASDALARRTSVVTTGSAYNPGRWTKWVYNGRNELTESRRFNGITVGNESSQVPTQQFIFDFDSIGNRQSYRGDGVEGAMSYTTNELNQYESTSSPNELFTYDTDGDLTQDGKYDYTYDGENRLRTVTPRYPGNGSKKVRFTYDYLGRRVRKEAWSWTGSAWSQMLSLDRRFVYDGWNLLEELNGLSSNVALFKYTWGLDLSGQNGNNTGGVGVSPAGLHSAGGIGGLLAMLDTKGTPSYPNDDRKFVYFYDANGNVGQLIECTSGQNYGTTQARYEYYPFGGILVSTGTYAEINPFKFSTKYRDSETGLYYYGYRYLSPRLGRWVNRDPMEERGGMNLYAAMRNDPADKIDPLGLSTINWFDGSTTTQPASTGEDHSQACCHYGFERRYTYGITILERTDHEWHTTPCSAGAKDPKECCKCSESKPRAITDRPADPVTEFRVFSEKRLLEGATWGKCCLCTVQIWRMRMSVETVGPLACHRWLHIKCDDWTYTADFNKQDLSSNNPIGAGTIGGSALPDDLIMSSEKRISCADAQHLRGCITAQAEHPPTYIWPFRQCLSWANDWFDAVEDLTPRTCDGL